MLDNLPLLVLIILGLPLAAAVVVAALGPRNLAAVRWVALAAVLADLILTGALVARATPILSAKGPEAPTIYSKGEVQSFEPIAVPGEVKGTHRTRWDLFEVPMTNSRD